MKTLSFLLLANALLAQETPSATAKTTPTPVLMNGKSSMLIDPKARAGDYIQAFNLLRKEKPTLKITIRTASGVLSNVSDLALSQNGTLFFVRLMTPQGNKLQILPVEELMEIDYSPQ